MCVYIYVNTCVHARMYAHVRERMCISVYTRIRVAYRIRMRVSGCRKTCAIYVEKLISLKHTYSYQTMFFMIFTVQIISK